MGYTCPLCKQSVSPSLYRKITGIWEERQRVLQKIKEQRARLLQKIDEQRKKLRNQLAEFRKEKAHVIKQAVDKQTSRLESKISALKRREEEVEKHAREKIRIATEEAQRKAGRQAAAQLNSFKKEIRASLRGQLKKERQLAAQRAETKYGRLRRSLTSALEGAKIKDRQVHELRKEIEELQKQLKRETWPQKEGLLSERELATELHRRFPEDKVQHTGKGGDVIQTVVRNGEQTGIMVYECKRVKHYYTSHVKQALEAKEKRKADFAILVTNAMKKGTQGFFTERGVIVVHPAGLLSLTNILRSQIIQIAEMKLGQQERDKAIKMTLEYLEGPEFSNSMDAIIQESIALYQDLMEEVKKHIAGWKKRYSSYKKVHKEAFTVKTKSKALLSGEPEYKKLIITEALPALPELPDLEKESPSLQMKPTQPPRHQSEKPQDSTLT